MEDIITKEKVLYYIAFLGHYTKDTIVTASGTKIVDGGAFNYGSEDFKDIFKWNNTPPRWKVKVSSLI